ncbi:sulfur oxidation c-type cytochrome SoxX [Aquincola sp. S2]|uniref:Sulfur oxidation c-type cytochrome SoxX n=1 Tax=Pseudaquabacterium terrae TaxID=2732868 RepID=A0ABX2EL52_9BURK|nr:sulfur oxidation c-type cytochrome SoxX [Aquabacterium terrae]NRF69329.1 sulfur oxidation c-type cytochrome SoxX [Aquabacterium terrae]
MGRGWWLLLGLCNVAMAAAPGDPARGAAIVANRALSQCVLCHPAPGVPAHLRGDLAPDLAGVGARLNAEQLRLRIVEPQRFNPETIMPAYGRIDGLTRAAPAQRGKPLLDAQQIEDVVAYLATLH